ncbi:MAG: TetR/AcrR family transcriptional regulator [Nitrososphaerales archaeon]
MSPRVTRSYKQEVKRRILASAFKEFSLRGYDKANLDDVAKSVGIARATIYLYFDSKQQLFETLSEKQLERLRRLLTNLDWSSGNAGETARAFFKESKKGLPENGERMSVELLAESTRNESLKRQRLLESRKMQQIISEVVQGQMKDRKLSSRDIRQVALGALALYNGLAMLKALGYDDQEIEDSFARTVELIIEGANKTSLSVEALTTR